MKRRGDELAADAKRTETMRRDWDQRAKKDAYFYIASWRKDWDEASFFKSGEEDYRKIVEPVLERFHFSPQGKAMLELGCGVGRMTRCFAQKFERVTGFDVSDEMLDRARELNSEARNITWVQGNGEDLGDIASSSADFVFSYLVLQHLPAETLVHAYVREILRVLNDGGICLFQFNGTTEKYMNWKGRLAWGVIDLLWAIRLRKISRFAAKMLGMDPEMAGNSWHGVGIHGENVAQTIRAAGSELLELAGADTPMAWCCARKVSLASGAPAL
jgi:SAM-dependent methyltransferase